MPKREGRLRRVVHSVASRLRPPLEDAYTPTQTSLKAPFRADGRDQQSDQELTPGDLSDRWNAEDRFTNKSGDPRIGTHGRAYEPGETRR